MSPLPSERLYALLPAIYRQRDAAQGEPLRAFLALIEEEVQALEADIAGLYDNWFVETCDEWVLPYLGDLLGMPGQGSAISQVVSQRPQVANALRYRRRKGVPGVLERVIRNATGWYVRVVESFPLLGLTQHLHNVRPGQGATVDLRQPQALAALDTPFATVAVRPDVRRPTPQARGHNLVNLRLYLWRLSSLPMRHTLVPSAGAPAGCYTFHPLGLDMPLFNRPQPQTTFGTPTDAQHLPVPLSRAACATPADRQRYYGPERSLCVYLGDQVVAAEDIVSQDLSTWQRPAPGKVAIDVELGRLAFAPGAEPGAGVTLQYHYGSAADIGGGAYDRRATLADPAQATWQITVGQDGHDVDTIQEALDRWQEHCRDITRPHYGIIRIMDNEVYALPAILAAAVGSVLHLEAADGARPVLRAAAAEISAAAASRSTDYTVATVMLNGLLLDVRGELRCGGPLHLTLRHCTLRGLLRSADAGYDTQVQIDQSLLGPLRLAPDLASLTIRDSVIDGGDAEALHATDDASEVYGPSTVLERVTVLGAVSVRELRAASEVIFTAPVQVQRRQTGLVRFSYVPRGSQTPRQYRCVSDADPGEARPQFTSRRYGDPSYAQLSTLCPPAISTGAEAGLEMGAFQHLLQPLRTANLQAMLDEYMPVGLEPGLVYMT